MQIFLGLSYESMEIGYITETSQTYNYRRAREALVGMQNIIS